MESHHESFILIAEALRNNFHRLSTKILEDPKYRPHWTVDEVPQTTESPDGKMVGELSEILSLALKLEAIAYATQRER